MRVFLPIMLVLLLSGCIEEKVEVTTTTSTLTSTSTTTSTILDAGDVVVTTDRTNYSGGDVIGVTVTNGLKNQIYLSGKCSVRPWYIASIVIDRMEKGWERIYDTDDYGNCSTNMPLYKIRPGVAVKMLWNFSLPAPVEGLYRAGVVYSCDKGCSAIPVSYSDSFFINANEVTTTSTFPKNMSYETISKRIYSGHEQEINLVINNTQDWRGIWEYIIDNRVKPLPLPEIDFERYILLAMFSGVGPSNREIGITRIIEHENMVEVFVMRGETSGCSRCKLNPHHIVKIKKENKTIIFHTER